MVQRMPPRAANPVARVAKRPDPALTKRARAILRRLEVANPDWGPTLRFTSPLELLVATILAAQAQDERINEVTATLFRKYRTPADYASARKGVLERDIKATGFYNQKAKALRRMSRGLLDEFDGEVPADMEKLTSLHGVGRKTASIVLGAAFGVPAVAVDRHVARVAERLGLAKAARGIEESLRTIYPRKDWIKVTWCFVLHGRRVCRPTPACPACPVIEKTKALPAGPAIPRARRPRAASRRSG